jgi:hypothetical protein
MRVLDKPEPQYRAMLHEAITHWFEGVKSDLPDPVGFVAIAWSRDNTYTIHDWFSEGSHVSRSMGPHFVSESMRRRNAKVDSEW